jgi:hypothetical protein
MREQAPAHAFRTTACAGFLDDLTTTGPKHRYPGPPAILAPVRTACSSFAKPLPVARAPNSAGFGLYSGRLQSAQVYPTLGVSVVSPPLRKITAPLEVRAGR